MAVDAREIIEGLREEIRRLERRPAHPAFFIPSGCAEVDALLPGGGFPRGAITELAGSAASGKTEIALGALTAAMGDEGLAAYVDGRGELYPPAVAALGLDLDRLLVVRPKGPDGGAGGGEAAHALWASELLLASGAFEGVVVDVPIGSDPRCAMGGARLDAMLRRLRAAAEKGGGLALWLGAPEGTRVPGAVRLELSEGRTGRRVRRTFAREVAAFGVHHAA
ncbi:MAG TPA: hypothetical protein VLV17_08645 [Anaeromyxobacteraceae bacterium]|nr:hypothetical protein [Anaeromyxobacteraceae bacterium]